MTTPQNNRGAGPEVARHGLLLADPRARAKKNRAAPRLTPWAESETPAAVPGRKPAHAIPVRGARRDAPRLSRSHASGRLGRRLSCRDAGHAGLSRRKGRRAPRPVAPLRPRLPARPARSRRPRGRLADGRWRSRRRSARRARFAALADSRPRPRRDSGPSSRLGPADRFPDRRSPDPRRPQTFAPYRRLRQTCDRDLGNRRSGDSAF